MQLFAVLRKDLTQSFRSFFALAFMFLVPMMTTVLFYFIFGGNGNDEEEFELPRTRVVVVNEDQGQVFTGEGEALLNEFAAGTSLDISGVVSMGDLLVRMLGSDMFSDIIEMNVIDEVDNARSMVDQQEAGVAIIIPGEFSDAMTEEGTSASVELYKDPTLTIGPAIVESILTSVLDGFMSNKITIGVALEQFAEAGGAIDQQVIQQAVERSSAAIGQSMGGSASSAVASPVEVVELAGEEQTSMIASILGVILAGMSIFYMFFTGAASMNSILTEEEKGTLPRLFTTPTPRSTILYGKTLAVLVILIVQISVLLIFGRFVFGIYWGEPLPVAIVTLFAITLAAATGLFIISWLTNTRQTGAVFGGGLTITGMLGMVTIFAGGAEAVSPAVQTASLLVPQGWAVRAFHIAMGGGNLVDLLPTLAGILAWTLIFGVIGLYRLRRRFA